MILHTLNASPASAAFAECLGMLGNEDAVLLMGDGVYAALPDSGHFAALQARGAGIYLLQADAAAAGLQDAPGDVQIIDMDGFVALTERFPRQLAWY